MLGSNFPSASYLPPNGGSEVLAQVDSILRLGDLTFGNLEGVIHGAQTPVVKRCNNPDKCYAFKSPDEYALQLAAAGFDVVSVANNHINDFGSVGATNTLRMLDSAGIAYAGLKQCPTTIIEHGGQRIGFTAFSPNRGTLQITNLELLKTTVQSLDAQCDLVIVSFHGGAEGLEHQHIRPGTETYLGENRGDPIRFARAAIDAGADVVLGHGPHVPRALDLYKDRIIAYSLGNFATYARFSLKEAKGFAPILDLEIAEDGKFISGRIHSAIQLGRGIPHLDAEHRAFKRIQSLTEKDRPDSGLSFDESGRFWNE